MFTYEKKLRGDLSKRVVFKDESGNFLDRTSYLLRIASLTRLPLTSSNKTRLVGCWGSVCLQRWWIAVTIFTVRCLALPSRTLSMVRKTFTYNRFVNKYERPLLGGWHVSFHFYYIAVVAVVLNCINWKVFLGVAMRKWKSGLAAQESASRGDSIIPLVRQVTLVISIVSSSSP